MEATARAGIDIYGSVLRYAEVEQYGNRYRLLRLGSCDFDFDVAGAVLQGDQTSQLATIGEALADVFSGSVAASYHVTLHPPGCYSFFTPLPAGITESARKVRLQQEAALLAGVDTPLRLTADALHSEHPSQGARVDWVHVLAVPERLHARFDRILRGLPQPRHRLMLSMQAAATTLARLHRQQAAAAAPGAPYGLAVGCYPTHVEYTLCREQRWQFSRHTAAGAPTDTVYFAALLLQRMHVRPEEVGRLAVYGPAIPADVHPLFEKVLRRVPERLNPLAVVDLDPGSLTADFDAEAYVPCLGASL